MKARLLTSALAIGIAANAGASPAQPAPATPAPQQNPTTHPNVLIWLLDDTGFAQLTCFGGLIDTPNIDRVAAMGLRYSNYHTPAICSASRASLLTGRNAHSVHIGGHAAVIRPYPGYDSKVPPEDGTIAANLRAAGYATFALGKWDHLPTVEMTPAGPFTHWPTGQGFDSWYGFLSADIDNWHPALIRDRTPVATPQTPGYHLNRDLADQAIAMIASRNAANPERPFFMYYATGTAHAPHHAPADWIARYRGKFDMGWDKARELILQREIAQGLVPAGTRLAPRPEGMPAWDSLTPDQKRLYARQMEVFAASLSYADAQFGRILDALKASGELDNTIVIITSDNGASAEGAYSGTYNEMLFPNAHFADDAENMPFLDKWGGPETYPHYSFGWAVAGDTPFRYYKQTTHEGGIHVPLVIAWPKGIAAHGEVRSQFVHVSDIAPTILDLAHVQPAAVLNDVSQAPMEGESFAYSLADAKAPDRKQAQYFEMYGNKSLWAKGWTIVTTHRTKTWDMKLATPPDEPWELYDVTKDPGQTTDLAKSNPKKVAELAALFDEQAKRFNVYPIGNMSEARPYAVKLIDEEFQRRGGKWVFPAPVAHISEQAGPPTTLRPYRLTVALDLPTGRETGPIYVQGGQLGGMGLYLKAGVPVFMFRSMAGVPTTVAATTPLPKGASTLELDFARKPAPPLAPENSGVTIKSNGRTLVSRTVNIALPMMFGTETFDIGIDYGSALSSDYSADKPFPGTIGQTVFDFNR
jgi:arylsulfatase